MKRKLLIFSSLITLLLSCFSFPIYAEESIEDIEELAKVDLPDYALDQYFYDNYVLLPFIQSDGTQYIDTGIKGSSDYKINLVFSDIDLSRNSGLFGESESNNQLFFNYLYEQSILRFYFYIGNTSIPINVIPYNLYNFIFDRNIVYFNGSSFSVQYSEFLSQLNILIFGRNSSSNNYLNSSYKLYKFSIYDYNSESFIRYYYPAKSKSSGIIGLYDSISKTFVTTSGSVPFSSPIDDQVMSFQISDFIDASLNWIEAIFLAIIEMPIIIVFIAIGLAGVMFRWGRRIVHF